MGNTHPEEWRFSSFEKHAWYCQLHRMSENLKTGIALYKCNLFILDEKLLPLIFSNYVFWKKKSYFRCNFSGRFTCFSIGQENWIWKCFGLMVKLKTNNFFLFIKSWYFRGSKHNTLSFYSFEKLLECALKPRLFLDFSSLWNDLFGLK